MQGILVDVTRCTGCERCVEACVDAHGLDREQAEVDRATTWNGLSDQRLMTPFEIGPGRFARKSCMHCLEPSCVSACLVGALTKTDDGPVVYDADKCIGCRYCMLACPFHIPRYEWSRTSPLMQKCDLCQSRLAVGGQPACTEACPHQAMIFGERRELLAMAHARLRERPDTYLPHVWGETEFGGTSILYISDVDLSAIDWPAAAMPPVPHLTEPLIAKTPFIGLGVGTGLLAVNWIIRRRMRLMRGEGQPETMGEVGEWKGTSDG